jgi:lysophospholipase L1-like esterase
MYAHVPDDSLGAQSTIQWAARWTRLVAPARFVGSACLSLLTLLVLVAPAHATDRVMCLGDSITYGTSSTNVNGYRRPLYFLLSGGGFDFDLVGSLADGSLDFDRDHEGRPGWRADQLRDNIYTWLTNSPADYVLLHIGTNDINGGQDAAGTRDEVAQLLDNIDQWESDNGVPVTVVLAQIINRSNPLGQQGHHHE